MSDASVTNIETRRRTAENVLRSVTFVFGGVHYGTVPIEVPYTQGEPLVLYIVPENDAGGLCGPIDALVTDDGTLGTDVEIAR
jgi:hypothetical protein